jgi:hypothetical protein
LSLLTSLNFVILRVGEHQLADALLEKQEQALALQFKKTKPILNIYTSLNKRLSED